jgi:type IV fimbrial biogenesis protein FimT
MVTAMRRKSALGGFSFVELMVVIAIAGIVMAIAAPSMTSWTANQRASSTAVELMSALTMARSEAIKRNENVTITPVTSADWASGWEITGATAPTQVSVQAPLSLVGITGGPATVVYNRSGRINNSASPSFLIAIDGEYERCVTIELTGLPRVKRGSCS